MPAARVLIPLPFLVSRATNAQNSAEIAFQSIGNNAGVFSGSGCNVLVRQTNAGHLIVDGGLEQHSEALLDAIKQEFGNTEISMLMNTHWHREQTGLNTYAGQSGARIFAHENTRQWLGTPISRPWEDFTFAPLPEAARPNETFYHYGDLSIGETPVQYGYMRQSHTDGDMYVYLPEENILHGGGVVSNDGWPLMDWWTGGWIAGLVDGLEILLSMADDDTVIIPANGPLMSKAELQEMRDMYNVIFERVRDLFRSAASPQETLDARPTAEFDRRWGNSDQFVLLAHQSVLAHYAPDA